VCVCFSLSFLLESFAYIFPPSRPRYVRFNTRLDGCATKEIWKAFDTSEGVEVAWNTLCLEEVPRSDKKR